MADADRAAGAHARPAPIVRLLREPLVQFLLIGMAIFGSFTLVDDSAPPPADDVIAVTPADVDRLAEQFEAVWRRPPDASELDGLIDDHVREEVYYREALALGLDRNDAVIRRRLRQKMEFLGDTGASALAPDEATLRAHFRDNADRFTPPRRVSFQQVFLGEGDAPAVLAALRDGADPASVGRPSLLPPSLDRVPRSAVDGTFGAGFFDAVADLPERRWEGPVPSAFGPHLVRLQAREEAVLPPFESVRDRVEEDWRQTVAADLRAAQFAAMRQRYTVVLPEDHDGA